jgi:DNA mismatch repair protein MutL
MRSVLTFVNGRPVRDRLISGVVNRAFANLIERGRYPLAVLFVEVPADTVDVNVHPQKSEVRFVKPKLVADLILDGIHQTLFAAPYHAAQAVKEPIFPQPPYSSVARHVRDERLPEETAPFVPRPEPTMSPPPEVSAPLSDEPPGTFSLMGIVGKLPGSFVVLHNDRDLIVLDHHAAHERILFEELSRAELRGRQFQSQGLLIPRVLEFSPVEARALAAHLDLLHDAGFEIEEFGEHDFVVKGVPGWINDAKIEDFFGELIDVLLETGVRGDPARLRDAILKSMACSAAVKESEHIQPEEIRSLLKDLDRIGAPETCPHGRPLTAAFALSDIRRRMGRR